MRLALNYRSVDHGGVHPQAKTIITGDCELQAGGKYVKGNYHITAALYKCPHGYVFDFGYSDYENDPKKNWITYLYYIDSQEDMNKASQAIEIARKFKRDEIDFAQAVSAIKSILESKGSPVGGIMVTVIGIVFVIALALGIYAFVKE